MPGLGKSGIERMCFLRSMSWLMSSFSAVGRWRFEAAIFLLQQLGEGDGRVVAILRADDLHADRQSVRRLTDRHRRGGQQGHARIAGPEDLVDYRHLLVVDHDGAQMAQALLIVRSE